MNAKRQKNYPVCKSLQYLYKKTRPPSLLYDPVYNIQKSSIPYLLKSTVITDLLLILKLSITIISHSHGKHSIPIGGAVVESNLKLYEHITGLVFISITVNIILQTKLNY